MPLINTSNLNFDLDEVQKALNSPEAGLREQGEECIKAILDSQGASKEEAARIISEVMRNPNRLSQIQLRAAETVLELHEVRNKDGKLNRQPLVNFIIKSDQVNIQNIFNPDR